MGKKKANPGEWACDKCGKKLSTKYDAQFENNKKYHLLSKEHAAGKVKKKKEEKKGLW